jgi:hypothetical protein
MHVIADKTHAMDNDKCSLTNTMQVAYLPGGLESDRELRVRDMPDVFPSKKADNLGPDVTRYDG